MSWKRVRIGDIAAEDRFIVPPESAEAAVRPYLGLEQIESNTGRILSYDQSSAEGKSTTFAFDEAHVLYGKLRPYLNKVALPNRKGRCSTEIIPLIPKGIDRNLLAVLLRTEKVISAVMSEKTGSRMPRADMNILRGLEVTIPELEDEQARMASQLTRYLAEVEKARSAAAAQVQDARLLQKRILEETFLRSDAGERMRMRIGDFASVVAGGTPSRGNSSFYGGTIPWVKTLDLNNSFVQSTQEKITEEGLRSIRGDVLPRGSVMVAMYGGGGTIGKSGLLAIEAATNQAVASILPDLSKFDSSFLHFQIMAIRSEWMRYSQGNRKDPNISKSVVENMEVWLPDPLTQQRIAAQLKCRLKEVSELQSALEMQLHDLEQLPNRILAQTFEN